MVVAVVWPGGIAYGVAEVDFADLMLGEIEGCGQVFSVEQCMGRVEG